MQLLAARRNKVSVASAREFYWERIRTLVSLSTITTHFGNAVLLLQARHSSDVPLRSPRGQTKSCERAPCRTPLRSQH